MPRNGSGTYSIPITLVPNTLATAGDLNTDFSDIATALTGSLPRDGQAGMSGQFKSADGSVTAPGMGFSAETGSGFFRKSAGVIGIAILGVEIGTYSAASGFTSGIVGEVRDYAGSTAPDGWLLCYGQAISRTTYSSLYAVIGTTFGAGDGSTTFNVPDLRGRIRAGKDNMGGSAASRLTSTTITSGATTIGNSGGEQTHVLTTAELAAHSHGVTDAGHSHGITDPTHAHTYTRANYGAAYGSGGGIGSGAGSNVPTDSIGTGISINSAATGVTINSAGSDTAHNNVQPTMIFNTIIKY